MGLADRTADAPGTVRVEIDELLFDGLDRRVDPDLVAAAFTTELERLLHRHGVPPAVGRTDQDTDLLDGLPELPATTSPERLGAALARSVHAGLSGRGRAR